MAEEDEVDQGTQALYFQGGPQEHEPAMGCCADHCTEQNYMEDSCCPMCGKRTGGPKPKPYLHP